MMQAENQTGNIVTNNYLGTDRNGTSGIGNGTGIVMRADGSAIIANVIAGNGGPGILIANDADNVTVTNNKIGMLQDGVSPLGNTGDGIAMDQYAQRRDHQRQRDRREPRLGDLDCPHAG